MKKLLSLLLVVMMLVPALALAETYTHPDEPIYSYTMPEGWTVLSKDTADKLLELGGSLSDDPKMSSYVQQAKDLGMVFFLAPGMKQTAYMIAQPLPGASAITPELMTTMLAPMLLAQFQSTVPDSTVENEGELLTCGDNTFLKLVLSYSESGIAGALSVYICLQDDSMYIIAYNQTEPSADLLAAFEETLASFTVGK